ncbi:hypothetical protein P4126_31005 [Pseudomonas aeruginosa]|nr:hypothetical protein [Pseudomonas aeruginosa]
MTTTLYENAGSEPFSDDQLRLLELWGTGTSHFPRVRRTSVWRHVRTDAWIRLSCTTSTCTREGVATAIKRGEVDRIIAEVLRYGEIDEAELAEIIVAHRQHLAARHAEVGAVITLHRRVKA